MSALQENPDEKVTCPKADFVEKLAEDSYFHQFSTTVMETLIFFHVTKLGRSIYIWIGDPSGEMNDLAYSVSTPYDKGLPVSTKVLGNSAETLSTALASRLTSKLKKPVFISYNVITRDGALSTGIEARLMEEIKSSPSRF